MDLVQPAETSRWDMSAVGNGMDRALLFDILAPSYQWSGQESVKHNLSEHKVVYRWICEKLDQ